MFKGYNVFRNDKFVEFIPSRSRKAMKEFIRDRAIIGTHMGEWHRVSTLTPKTTSGSKGLAYEWTYEWTYSTTVGAYFLFKPALGS